MSQEPTAAASAAHADPDQALADALRQTRVLHEPPEAVIQRAIDLFATRPRLALPLPSGQGVRRLTAVLAVDTWLAAPAAGLRSGTSAERKMLFFVDGCDIDLRIARDVVGWQVSGQVLGPDGQGVVELQAGDFRAEAAWNSLCEFHLSGVPSGCWRLALRTDDWVVRLPDLQVPADAG